MRRVSAQRGVTLVELLVTIVLAGIVFAALVPVFVAASRSSSVDRARVTAMNIAQSRLEAIRSLNYDDITAETLTALEADLSEGRDLRFDAAWKSDPESKVYRVTYDVKDVAGTVTTDPQQYKIVAVTVSWDGPPQVGKPIILRTAIYRQASGPQATGLRVYTEEQPSATQTFWTGPIKASLTLSKADAASVDYVRFVVYANNGSQVDTGTVSNVSADSPAYPLEKYDWTWLGSEGAPDGAYTFAAVAVAVDSEQTGNMWQKPFYIDHMPPEAPKWAPEGIVTGANAMMVTWQAPTAGDLSHYQVERQSSGVTEVFDDLPRWSTTLVDRHNLVAGQSYQYRVCAWDESGQQGPWSEWSTPALLGGAAGAVPAFPPPPVVAEQMLANAGDESSRQRQVTVRWTASADDGATGFVTYYFVYRSQIDPATAYVDQGDGFSSPLKVITVSSPQVTYETSDAAVDWRSIYQYGVTAVDSALRESARSESSSVAVLLPTGDFFLTVYAAADPDLVGNDKWYARLSIVSLDTGEVYPQPWGITQINDKIWVNGTRPYVQELSVFGRYQVVVSFFTQTGVYLGTNSGFIDLAEGRQLTVTYATSP